MWLLILYIYLCLRHSVHSLVRLGAVPPACWHGEALRGAALVGRVVGVLGEGYRLPEGHAALEQQDQLQTAQSAPVQKWQHKLSRCAGGADRQGIHS